VPNIPEVIEIDTITQSNSSTSSSQSSNNIEPPSMKMIGMLEQFGPKPTGVQYENNFNSNFIKIITIVKITPDPRPSVLIQRIPENQSLMMPPRNEMRRLSENPRNINILHDIPREKKIIFKKRKSAMSSRSAGRKILAKLINMK
jgi:hypothetical protein